MFLKNRNIIFKMKISKVTDYAALNRGEEVKTPPLEVAKFKSGGQRDRFSQRNHLFNHPSSDASIKITIF